MRDPGPPLRPGRRSFLALTGVSTAAFVLGIEAPAFADITATVPADPFGLGVASGDPTPDGVVLWTRLAPDPLAPDGHGGMPRRPVPVHWQVATDERFRNVVRSGVAIASPELAHSVHPEVRGLEPGREYFYRFRAGSEISPVGRTRTAPAPHTMPSELRFAFASCQAWYHGYYTAYEHMVAEDPDLIFFLGDYIYEYAINSSNLWREGVTLPSEHDAMVETLEQFRLRYGLFKSDPLLQAAHATAPWIVTTDDHEVENNYAGDVSSVGIPPEHFLRRRAVGYRAFYEHMPLRSVHRPSGPDLPLYRRLHYGRLAQFDVLDTRQFRDPLPCGEVTGNCPEREDPKRTMLGYEQEAWLYDGLAASDAVWNVLAQSIVMARIDRDLGPGETFSNEQWDGYPAARDRLFAAFRRHQIHNPVVLTGDIHRSVAANLKEDWLDPDSRTVGVELVCTSIASNGDGADTDSYEPIWLGQPHVELYHARRGYVSCRMTPTELTADFRALPYIQRPGAPISTVARFVTEAGNPGLQREG